MKLLRVISYVFSYIFFMSFILLFLPSRFKIKKSVFICTIWLLILGTMDYYKFFEYNDNKIMFVTISIIQIISIQSVSFYISKTRDGKAIFTSLISSNYVLSGNILGYIFYIFTGNLLFGLFTGIFMSIVILIFLVYKIRIPYLELFDNNMKGWEKLCIIPMLFYATLYFTVYFPLTLVHAKDRILIVLLMLTTILISYIFIFNYVDNQIKRSNIYWENKLFQSYIKGLESQYESITKAEDKLKILRHDMRHYVKIVHNLLDQDNKDEIMKILDTMSEMTDETNIKKYCLNMQVDSIIANFIEKAQENGIVVKTDLYLPNDMPVNSLELASVIANLFENAIHYLQEAEEIEKYINVMARYIDHRLIIEVKNVCKNDIIFNPFTKLPMSTKGEGHGIGLKSVAAFVEKTGANFDCCVEDDFFIVRILANF